MTFSKNELKELKVICDYLDSEDPDIKRLGFNLYITNYADKFISHIIYPRESFPIIWKYNRTEYVCDFSGYDQLDFNLSDAIFLAVIREGYDFGEV